MFVFALLSATTLGLLYWLYYYIIIWLPVRQRIQYKVAVLTRKVRMTGAPSYLSQHLVQHVDTGAREPWRQSRRGSHKISPNGAKIGLGSHKF